MTTGDYIQSIFRQTEGLRSFVDSDNVVRELLHEIHLNLNNFQFSLSEITFDEQSKQINFISDPFSDEKITALESVRLI